VVSAFVVLSDGDETSERNLIKYAASRLPAFQVPRNILFLDKFPRNNMGKIDKKQLQIMQVK
jgi:long-chain acyl-CoA synthetase